MYKNDVSNSICKVKIEHVNIFDENFLVSKDEALQPINIFFENEDRDDLNDNRIKGNHLSLKNIHENVEEKRTERSKKSKRSKKSQKSLKSTNNTNKKSARKKSIRNSQLYNSNIIIVNDEEEDLSPTDPVEKEVEKLKRLMARSKKKKNKNKASSKSLSKQ